MFWFKLRLKFLKPFNQGFLPEIDGHKIFYQELGNKNGEPILIFHGGPGGSSKPYHASGFDLKKYHIITFDQRGCGKSEYKDALYQNTIDATAQDAIRLLKFLNIKQEIIIAGASFGVTCALYFAQKHPELVKKIILNSVFLARKKDGDNMSPSAKLFYADVLETLQKVAKGKDIFTFCHEKLFSQKQKDVDLAMQYYAPFEHMIGSFDVDFPQKEYSERWLNKFKIFMHYIKNDFFLTENQLIKNAKKIAHIPTYIYHNRLDFICPMYQAHEIHKALKKSKLHIVKATGHCSPEIYLEMYNTFN
jgi:proline iminopeptidase